MNNNKGGRRAVAFCAICLCGIWICHYLRKCNISRYYRLLCLFQFVWLLLIDFDFKFSNFFSLRPNSIILANNRSIWSVVPSFSLSKYIPGFARSLCILCSRKGKCCSQCVQFNFIIVIYTENLPLNFMCSILIEKKRRKENYISDDANIIWILNECIWASNFRNKWNHNYLKKLTFYFIEWKSSIRTSDSNRSFESSGSSQLHS